MLFSVGFMAVLFTHFPTSGLQTQRGITLQLVLVPPGSRAALCILSEGEGPPGRTAIPGHPSALIVSRRLELHPQQLLLQMTQMLSPGVFALLQMPWGIHSVSELL